MTYEIRKSNDAASPFVVVWVSGSFVRSKGKYADLSQAKARARQLRSNAARKDRDQTMHDLGIIKVRGAFGGTYWE